MQTLEQERARQAWQDVSSISDQLGSKYGTQARKLPALIQINGLGQTMAFLRSKPDNQAMRKVYDHLSGWVMGRMGGTSDLLQAVTRWSSDEYRRATTEALAYALWLRRFAEAKGWAEGEEED
jgi:CRISPR-associated protein Cmr5